MGGMAAQIPIRADEEANQAALEKVRLDKLREVKKGHDGTWVAHPGLVEVARAAFQEHMRGPNQIARKLEGITVTARDLLAPPKGERTEAGLRQNIGVGVAYLAAWLGGSGCVPLHHLMEDAATAEISRAQVWQWIRHKATLADGRRVTRELVRQIADEEIARLRDRPGDPPLEELLSLANGLFLELATSDELQDFLTIPAYGLLTERSAAQ